MNKEKPLQELELTLSMGNDNLNELYQTVLNILRYTLKMKCFALQEI